MAKICELCGKQLGWGDVYNRQIDNMGVQLCDMCAFKYAGLQNQNNIKKITDSVWWAKDIVNKRKYNPCLHNSLMAHIESAEKTIAELGCSDSHTANIQQTASAENRQIPVNTSSIPVNNVNNYNSHGVSGATFWTGILKVVAVFVIVSAVIAGLVIGGMLADGGGAFIGFIVGLIAGAVSASVIMVFAEMAEDIKATREYTRQIRNMMNDNDK